MSGPTQSQPGGEGPPGGHLSPGESGDSGGGHLKQALQRVEIHLKHHFIYYTAAVLVLAVTLSTLLKRVLPAFSGSLTTTITVFAVLAIAPSMIQIHIEALPRVLGQWKAITVMVAYSFVTMPLLSLVLAPALGNRDFGTAFIISGAMPASSGALGFMLISGADLELGGVLIVLGSLLTLVATPVWTTIYTGRGGIGISPLLIIEPVIYILLTSLVGGQLIRFLILRYRTPEFIKDHLALPLSLTTMVATMGLLFFAVFGKGYAIIAQPDLLVLLLLLDAAMVSIVLVGGTVINRLIGLSYAENQAVMLSAATKNMATAIVVSTLAINPGAAVVPAIGVITFRMTPVIYIRFSAALRRWFTVEP